MTGVRVGDRIELLSMDDPYTRLRPGDVGTVTTISEGLGPFQRDQPFTTGRQIWVTWDSGPRLAMIEGEDMFKIVGHVEVDL